MLRQLLDKLLHAVLRHRRSPRLLLEQLVCSIHLLSPQHSLDRLRSNLPVVVDVGADRRLVKQQLAQTLLERVERDDAVPERQSDVARHRRVGEVALQPRDGQLLREVVKDGRGEPKVSFRVLKVDRVHLVRHSRGSDLASFRLLLEQALGDVGPDIAAEIDEDGVDPPARVEERSHVVVMLDLRRALVTLKPEGGDKGVGERHPITIRECDGVSIEVSSGTAKLCAVGSSIQQFQLSLQAVNKHHELLPHASRRCRLAVSACEQRDVRPLARVCVQRADDFRDFWDVNVADKAQDHEGVASVVDILGGETEVDKFLDHGELLETGLRSNLSHFILEKVLHGLNIVVCGKGGASNCSSLEFSLFHPQSVFLCKFQVDRAQLGDDCRFGLDVCELREGRGHGDERDEVLDLDLDPVFDVRVLGEVVRYSLEAVAVAAVEGTDSIELNGHCC
mmetsp:Transcript_54954/g.112219  ORF Transcript_54954/g.112219 Transcript_54954/m.112219 type:complete len:450 (+) Transcript_54954:319-1668(+)